MKKSATEFIKEIIAAKQLKNPRFSLRSIAKSANISPGHLSEILQGKREISELSATKLIMALKMSPQEKTEFLMLVNEAKAQERGSETQVLCEDVFSLIGDWEHYAVLALLRTANVVPEISWVAKRLSISPERVAETFARLEKLGMVKKNGDFYERIAKPLTSTADVPSESIRRAHLQYLANARVGLENVDVNLRDFSYMTIAIDPEVIPKVKVLINKFYGELSKLMDKGTKTEVYNVGMQFYPLTKEVSDVSISHRLRSDSDL